MFPIVLNGLDEDDEDLLFEANYRGNNLGFNEVSPLFQDNLRCNVSQRILRRSSLIQNRANQPNQPGERTIEIKSESEDEEQLDVAQNSSSANERINLLNNDYRFQRFKPIRLKKQDQTSDDHSQVRIKRNYEILKSKKRFTFPICFFVGLYISFLVMSSFIFTMFEQKMAHTDRFYELQKNLMFDLTMKQYAMVHSLIEQSIQIQRSGKDAMKILSENRKLISDLKFESTSGTKLKYDQDYFEATDSDTAIKISTTTIPSSYLNERLDRPYNYTKSQSNSSHELRNRRTYNWDFQQALFFVFSISTTIGYGNLTPESDYGKIYTIIFGMISIPYTTILFSIIVSKFSNGPLRRFKLSLLTKHFRTKNHDTLRIIRFICLILATFFILIIIMGLPAVAFSRIEKKWSYLDGFYFIFISITTTGLGDYVPEFVANLHYWLYELGVIIFLYFGIILIMLWLTLIKSVFRKSISIKLDEYDQPDEEEDRHETVLEEQVLINCHYRQKNYVNYGSFYGYDEVTVQVK